MNYKTSVINKYGDNENLRSDLKTLIGIYNRQGSTLFLDFIAEQSGKAAINFKMSEQDRANLIESLIKDLKEALLERV